MRTVWVSHRDDLLVVIEVVQQRTEDSPTGIQFIITDKVRVVTLQGVKNERLVGLGNLQIGEAAAVSQVELSNDSLHAQAGELRVHLDVDTLVGLDTDDQLVARDVLENARGDILELDADLGLLFVQSFGKSALMVAQIWRRMNLPFPAFRMKGTPSHLSFLMYATMDAKVGHLDSFGTVSSSLYPGLLPSRDFSY